MMAKQVFKSSLHMSPVNEERLRQINKIIENYAAQGYRLTLRQLYYQLVSKDLIPNLQREYAKLSTLLVKGRMGGVVDWFAIEDRLRVPYLEYSVDDIKDAIEDTVSQYKLNRQKGQEVYIELWCEKDALSGVLKRITNEFHIRLMVNRGYSSCTAMYDAYRRLAPYEIKDIKTIVLYLGDHDPSGLDMVRDIKKRLGDFGVHPEVRHIGITMEQIEEFNPPPNPAKITDPRAGWYMAEHGDTSWEVDALSPEVLHKLVRKHVEELIDMDMYEIIVDKEDDDKEKLQEFADKYEEEEGDM